MDGDDVRGVCKVWRSGSREESSDGTTSLEAWHLSRGCCMGIFNLVKVRRSWSATFQKAIETGYVGCGPPFSYSVDGAGSICDDSKVVCDVPSVTFA